ncbi:MAG: glycosyltransferase [Candidatus Scalindua sp.]|nr:glycosyltransferase [Candidatus Scalindua sp.]
MGKYNILVLSHLFPNIKYPQFGVFVLNRVLALNKYCNINVIAPIPFFPFMSNIRRFQNYEKVQLNENVDGLNVFHPRFPVIPRYLKWIDSISYFFATFSHIYKISKSDKDKIDLIDIHWTYPDSLTGFIWACLLKKNFIVTIRGKEALYIGENSLRKLIINKVLKKADAIVVLSTELKELVRQIGVHEKKIFLVFNGVDLTRFNIKNKDYCRKQLSIPSGKKVIISVGSLIYRKGFDKIINVLPNINKDFSVELYIIGEVGPEGDYLDQLKGKISSLKLKNVLFVGSKDFHELSMWYNAADVFCLASRGEGCPNVLMEALACGTPAVATEVGSVADIIEEDSMGYVVNVNDEIELENSIKRALRQNWNRLKICKSMQDRTWDNCAKQVLKVYDIVLKEKYDSNM